MTDLQATVLQVVDQWCSTDSGYATEGIACRVGRQPGHESNRQHSALIGATLRELASMGRVRHLDEAKPVIWCKAI